MGLKPFGYPSTGYLNVVLELFNEPTEPMLVYLNWYIESVKLYILKYFNERFRLYELPTTKKVSVKQWIIRFIISSQVNTQGTSEQWCW